MSSIATHNNWVLREELIKRSYAKKWSKAIKEWDLVSIESSEGQKKCLCSHYPIRELCHILNRKTGNKTIVGNVCVKLFAKDTLYRKTNRMFNSLHGIKKNRSRSANKTLLKQAFKQKILSKGEFEVYNSIWKKRSISERLQRYKCSLNQRIIEGISKEPEERIDNRRERIAMELKDLHQNKWARMELVELAYNKRWISLEEYQFYKGLWEKDLTSLFSNQQNWLESINRRIMSSAKNAFAKDILSESELEVYQSNKVSGNLKIYNNSLDKRILEEISMQYEERVDNSKIRIIKDFEHLMQNPSEIAIVRMELVDLAHQQQAITANDRRFYKDLWKGGMTDLSEKQDRLLTNINQCIRRYASP